MLKGAMKMKSISILSSYIALLVWGRLFSMPQEIYLMYVPHWLEVMSPNLGIKTQNGIGNINIMKTCTQLGIFLPQQSQ